VDFAAVMERVRRVRVELSPYDSAARFRDLGLPHRRVEAWKWSDLRAALREAPGLAPKSRAEPGPRPAFDGLDAYEIIIENGRSRLAGASVAAGLSIVATDGDGEGAVGSDDAVASLNAAHATGGVLITVSDETELSKPILIRYRSDAVGLSAARCRVVVEAGGSATLIELYESPGEGAFVNCYTEIEVERGARLRRYVVETSADDVVCLAVAGVRVGERATFEQAVMTTGAALSRHEARIDLAGEGAGCALASAFVGADGRHSDVTSFIRHDAEGGATRQEHRAVLGARARGVFQGKIKVERGGQKTDGRMAAHSMLLNASAEANAKPELEIYADDVQCAHGATVGALDEGALFYMRSRGVPERDAKALLIDAFLADALDLVSEDAVRSEFERLARAAMDGRLA